MSAKTIFNWARLQPVAGSGGSKGFFKFIFQLSRQSQIQVGLEIIRETHIFY